ncbi:MAG: hypothetical protein PVG65_07290 [Candidatus Thorarchaeota archaeon]|jgi:hypothetical protein
MKSELYVWKKLKDLLNKRKEVSRSELSKILDIDLVGIYLYYLIEAGFIKKKVVNMSQKNTHFVKLLP